MTFEFDAAKSAANRAKHGIDFVEAQGLWRGRVREMPLPYKGEPRIAVVGKLGERHWTAIVTPRGANTRLISVRRSWPKEIKVYEQSG